MIDRIVDNASRRVSNEYVEGAHTGIDLAVVSDEAHNRVFAHSDGIVVAVVDGKDRTVGSTGMKSYGNYIDIDHENGFKTRYAHLKKNSITVSVGQRVMKDEFLGIIGNTGNTLGVTGRHLHFEVFQNEKRLNPKPYLTEDFLKVSEISYQSHDNRYGWNPKVFIGTNDYAGNFGHSIDGLYLDFYRMRVHDMVKNEWLPWVQNRNDYAGNFGNPIDGLQIEGICYRVHIKEKGWLSWIDRCDDSSLGYAGLYGYPIDAIQVKFK